MPPVPKAIRVRTATGWQDIALQGPPGLTQVWSGPDPPAPRGDYVAWLDTDEASSDVTDRVTANEAKITALEGKRLLDVQTKTGVADVYSGTFTTQFSPVADRTGVGAQNMSLSYTPPVSAWWEVTGLIGIVQKIDAAYHGCYGQLVLTPTDADGAYIAAEYCTQHSQVQSYENRVLTRLFKLNAGVAYRIDLGLNPQGGTWNYYCGSGHLYIGATAWAR